MALEALSFQITADTEGAIKSLDKLSSSLGKFQTSAKYFNASKVSQDIQTLGSALNSIDTKKASSLASALNAIRNASKIDSSSNLTTNVKGIADAFSGMKTEAVTSFTKAIREMSKVQGDRSGGLRDTLIAVQGITSSMNLKDLELMSFALERMRKSLSTRDSNLAQVFNDVASAMLSLPDDAVEKIERLSLAIQRMDGVRLSGLGNIISQASEPATDTTKGDGTVSSDRAAKPAATGVSEAAQQTMLLDVALKMAGASLREMASSFAGTALSGLASALKSVGSAAKSAAKELVLLPMTLGTRFASQIKNVTASLSRLVHQFTRIATIKAIRAIISSITKSFQDSVKALYEYSSAVNGVFKSSMDSLSTSANYLSNSLAAMASPIYNALAPALDYLVDKIVTVLNWINMLFAALGGAATTTIAKKVPTTFGDASKAIGGTGGAAKGAAKELKRFILAFDEINALGSQNNGSGGGGGGGGAGGAGGLGEMLFEDIAINSAIAEFANKIKGFFDDKNWLGLGDFLGESFNNAIDSVKWDELGRKVGEGLKAIIETAYGFMRTVKFDEIGRHLAEFLNNAIGTVDWEYLGRLLTRTVTAAVDFAIGFVTNLDTEELARKLSDFIIGSYDELIEWLDSKNWTEVGDAIGTKIGDALRTFDWSGTALAIIQALAKATMALGSLGSAILKSAFEALLPTNIKPDWDLIFDDTNYNINIDGYNDMIEDKTIDGFTAVIEHIQVKIPKGSEVASEVGAALGSLLEGTFGTGSKQSTPTKSNPLTAPRSNYTGATPMTSSVLGSGFLSSIVKIFDSGTQKGVTSGVKRVTAEPFTKIIDAIVDSSFYTAEQVFDSVTDDTSTKTVEGRYGSGFKPVESDYHGVFSNTAIKTADGIRLAAFNTLHSDYTGLKDKTAKLTADGTTTSSFTTAKNNMNNAPSSKSATYTIKGDVLDSFYNAVDKIKNAASGAWSKITVGRNKALGGIFKGGKWSDIPQYAAGGSPHGSMFIAGEAGTELVGHINGATEVLNRSQLAATMLSAITAGMLQFVPALTTMDSHIMTTASVDYESQQLIAELLGVSAQQNQYLLEQNDLLRELLEKDSTVEISTASLTNAMMRRNQRDGKAVVPIG